MIFIADYDFVSPDIQLPFFFGEKTLFRLNFRGFRCHTDIFRNPEMITPNPPVEDLKESGYKIAYTSSYPLAKKISRISFHKKHICYVIRQYRRFFIKTDSGIEKYLERFKGKTISTIRRKVKKVSTSCQSESSFRVFSTPDEILEFLGIAKEISMKTYQFRLLNQGLQDSEVYRKDFIQRAQEGRILGFILYAEDQPVAYNLCPIYEDGVMIYYYTGFNPDFNKYSPGTVLQYKTIEAAFENDQIKIYDFCTGEGKHKELFTDDFKWCGDIYYFPLSPKFLFIIILKVSYDSVLELVKYIIRRLGKTEKIKKQIRNMAQGKRKSASPLNEEDL